MQISLVRSVVMAGIVALVQRATAGAIAVSPGEDFAAAVETAAEGDVIELAPGRYELSSTVHLANKKNLTLLGGGVYLRPSSR